ncbi:MAG: TlpA family protein disulfide reductase [Chloroflexi bacterium]|nr:TlpA family protein disulfide reductase [Chloroflexota bacterium]
MSESIASAPPKRRTGVLITFAVIGVIVVGLLVLLAFAVRQRGAGPLATGDAPDFTLTTFDGQTYTLSKLKGKPVVINFWASWCVPCRDEAPGLQRAWETYKDRGVLILGVDYVDTETDARKFIAEFKQTYPNGPDLATRISQAYKITGVPETYFVGKDGKLLQGIDDKGRVKGNWIGPLPEEVLNARIEEMLRQ